LQKNGVKNCKFIDFRVLKEKCEKFEKCKKCDKNKKKCNKNVENAIKMQ
jgi:hypothetical protein